MPSDNKHVQEYIQAICKEIRFKGVRKTIAAELTDHIEDQKNVYMGQGLDEDTASLKAVEQMGDPVLVGRQLDKAHRPKTDGWMLALAALVVLMGGAVQFFLSGVNADSAYLFSDFLVYGPVGIAACIFVYFFDYTLLERYSKLAYSLLLAATAAGFFFFSMVNGAYRHVYYFMLLFIPAYTGIIYAFRNRGYLGIIASGLFYAAAAALCLYAGSVTSLFFLTVCCLAVLTVAILKGFFRCSRKAALAIVYIPVAILLLFVLLVILSQSPGRLSIMLHPELDPMGAGWQHLLAKRLFAASQPFGEASFTDMAGMSIDSFLPGWTTDFSLAYLFARLGYVPGFIIVTAVFVLIVRMFIAVMRQKNAYGFLLSFSACLAISMQAALFVLSNTGVISPVSAIMPFVSFGSAGFIANMILLGLVLSVYRRTDLVRDRLQGGPDRQDRKRWFTLEDGKLIIDLGGSILKK